MISTRAGAGRGNRGENPPRPKDRLYDRLSEEVATVGLRPGHSEGAVTDADLAGLPDAVQRYMRFMGVVGRPRDWSFRARFTGRFRMRPDAGWATAEAWQYNSAVEIARVFLLRIRLAHLVPVVGRDTYVHGHGRMLVKLMNLVPVADGKGEEFDHSELITYLDDAVLLAPSMLLGPAVSWAAVGDRAFDVTLLERRVAADGRP